MLFWVRSLLKEILYEMRCFCKLFALLFPSEDVAVLDICNGHQSAEVVSAFCDDPDPKLNENKLFFKLGFHDLQQLSLYSKWLFASPLTL